ncbi:MAG TPA: hypothetical protein VHZ95_13455, partial [Polyangiales bacterium]|nr:hypothetical protein [Polyangiales bacterium]
MLPPFRMADGSSATLARIKSKLIGAVAALGCGFGLFVLMAHEGQLPHAVLLGLPLLVGLLFGLFAAGNLLRPTIGARTLADTAFYPLPGEPIWMAPIRTLPIALGALLVIGFALGGHHLPIAISVALAILFVSALRRPGLLVF